jgi:hypothetical protein
MLLPELLLRIRKVSYPTFFNLTVVTTKYRTGQIGEDAMFDYAGNGV